MSKDFIEKRIGSSSIAEARRQQKELSYFTQSKIQQPITEEYINTWAQRKYQTNEEFLNWVKTIFGTNNFLSVFKFLRNPVPSSKVVNNKIIPQLERVLFSEDSFFKYTIKGNPVEEPENLDSVHFSEWMLNSMLFRHNDILVTDLRDTNEPFRDLISIENVVALRSEKSVIKQLAFTASIMVLDDRNTGHKEETTSHNKRGTHHNDQNTHHEEKGFLYMDAFNYIFYDQDLVPILTVPHDLGECPADYIVPEAFSDDDIVRKSIWSFVRGDLEEFTFLKTLQRMTEPNGAIPVTAILKFKNKNLDGSLDNSVDNDDVDSIEGEPNAPLSIKSQQSRFQTEVVGKQTDVQTGTLIEVTPRLLEGGGVDAAAVQNYIKHFYMPVEAMDYLNKRISEIQNDLIQSVTGDFKEQNEAAQNELQVGKGYKSKEDCLRKVSKGLSRIRWRSDFKMLALEFGPDSVTNEAFYGSAFFPESQDELYDLFEKAPNPIERKNTLKRLNRNKNRFNKDQSQRTDIEYDLMPYAADKDFQVAVDSQRIDGITFQYQTRFPYWIAVFESTFGDLVLFWEGLGDSPDSTKLLVINNFITDLIKASGVQLEPPEPKPIKVNT